MMSQPKKKRPVRARMLWTDLWEEGGCGRTLSVQKILMLRGQLASNSSWRGNIHIAEKETSDSQDRSNKWPGVVQMWAKNSGLWSLIAKVRLLFPRASAPPQPQGLEEACLPKGRMLGRVLLTTGQKPSTQKVTAQSGLCVIHTRAHMHAYLHTHSYTQASLYPVRLWAEGRPSLGQQAGPSVCNRAAECFTLDRGSEF